MKSGKHIGAVSLTGFQAKTRSSSRGGGVGIYISKQHRFEVLEKVNNLSMKCLEIIGVKVYLGKYVVKIISIYRPPNANLLETIHDMDLLLNNVGNGNVVIAGDLDINLARSPPPGS